MCIRPGVKNSYRAALTCMRNIYIYIYIPYRHVANDEAQYYIHLRLYCRLYVYNYVYPIQIYQIYCTMLAVSAESVTEQRARSRDLRHEASTVVVTATMGSAVAKLAVEQDFERCSELRRWRLEHEGAKPNRRSDDPNKKSLANWLSMVLPRRFRASGTKSSQRKLTVEESAHSVMCVRRESFWLQRRHYHRGKLCCKWQLCPWSGLPDHQGRIMSIDVRQGCRERKTVATVDGSVYDRVHIEQWIRTCR